jgi:hypothetical protein
MMHEVASIDSQSLVGRIFGRKCYEKRICDWIKEEW